MKTGLLQPLTNIELQQKTLHYKVTSEVNHNHYGETLKVTEIIGTTDFEGYPNYPNGVDSNLTFTIGSGKQIIFNNKNDLSKNAAYDANDGTFSAVKFLAKQWTSDDGFNSGGYSFIGDGNWDTGMFSTEDGNLIFKSNAVTRFSTSSSSNTVNFYGNVNTSQNYGFTFGSLETTGLYLNSTGNLVFRLNNNDIVRTTGSYDSAIAGTDLMLLSTNVYMKNRLLIGAHPNTNMFNAESSSTNSIQMLSSTSVGGIHDQHTAIIMSATLGVQKDGYADNWYPEFTIRGASYYATYGSNLLKVNKDGVFQYGGGAYQQLASRLFATGEGNAGLVLVVDETDDSVITWKTAANIFQDSGITASYPLVKNLANLSLNMKEYFTVADNSLALTGVSDNPSKFLMVNSSGTGLTWGLPAAATIVTDGKSIVGSGTSGDALRLLGLTSGNQDKYLHYKSDGSAIDWKTAAEIVSTGLDANNPIYISNGKISIYEASGTTSGYITTGNQTIAGAKTFSSTISGSIDGNASTVTNGVYTTGSYSDPTWITHLAYSKLTGAPILGTIATYAKPTGNGPYVTWDGSTFGSGTPAGGASLPDNAAGYLKNDGSGALSWDAVSTGGISDVTDAYYYVRTSGSWVNTTTAGLLTNISITNSAPLTKGASGGTYTAGPITNSDTIGLAYNTTHFQLTNNLLNIHADLITKINSGGGKMDIWSDITSIPTVTDELSFDWTQSAGLINSYTYYNGNTGTSTVIDTTHIINFGTGRLLDYSSNCYFQYANNYTGSAVDTNYTNDVNCLHIFLKNDQASIANLRIHINVGTAIIGRYIILIHLPSFYGPHVGNSWASNINKAFKVTLSISSDGAAKLAKIRAFIISSCDRGSVAESGVNSGLVYGGHKILCTAVKNDTAVAGVEQNLATSIGPDGGEQDSGQRLYLAYLNQNTCGTMFYVAHFMSPTYANIFSYIFKSTYNNSYSPLYGASYNTLNTKYDINLRHMEIGDANGNISTSILEDALGGLDLDNSNYDTKIT